MAGAPDSGVNVNVNVSSKASHVGTHVHDNALDESPPAGPEPASATSSARKRRASLIRSFVDRWLGTHCVVGGASIPGIDDAKYVQRLFREVFSVELPSSLSKQMALGQSIPTTMAGAGWGLEPADLFFHLDSSGVPTHVVVYIGSGKFTHCAEERGVVVDGFDVLHDRNVVARRVSLPLHGEGELR